MPQDKDDKLASHHLLSANARASIAQVCSFFATQPAYVILRHQQAALLSENPRVLTAMMARKEIRAGQRGLAPFFKGAAPGFAKEFGRNLTYKGALIVGAPHLAEVMLPTTLSTHASTTQYQLIRAVTAGFIASASDTILGGPLEAYATYLATSQGKHTNASFSGEFKQAKGVVGKTSLLYRGFVPMMAKGTFAFSTLFALTNPVQAMTATFYQIDPKKSPPWYSTATAAALCGFGVALVSLPFDIAKTHAQMPGSLSTSSLEDLARNYRLHGIRGCMVGLSAKTLITTIRWGFSFFAIQSPSSSQSAEPEAIDNSTWNKTK